jgi:aryl-alcohol dehydrogenase-like predicted oxidoreductase
MSNHFGTSQSTRTLAVSTRTTSSSSDSESTEKRRRRAAFAEERGHSLHELAICALASISGICSIIAGATKPEQVRTNVAAAEVGWRLSGDELEALAQI